MRCDEDDVHDSFSCNEEKMRSHHVRTVLATTLLRPHVTEEILQPPGFRESIWGFVKKGTFFLRCWLLHSAAP